jgi:hypothetical protein
LHKPVHKEQLDDDSTPDEEFNKKVVTPMTEIKKAPRIHAT